ncbi:MAG: DUF1963 domain-containing protein [Roseibium sp.]|uniref:DUF1963 domain-containing protein n=1 Tax=Roseibium sp. TaxID=1936156 RepID=UPI003D9C2BEA
MTTASPAFTVEPDRIHDILVQSSNRAARRIRRPVPEAQVQTHPKGDADGSRLAFEADAARDASHPGTPPRAEREILETVSVVLRRQVPIRADEKPKSWFGGLPMMPDNVPWPKSISLEHPQRGEIPLHFLAQICCAELPEELWGGLGPRDGWLLFFIDPNACDLDGRTEGFKVIHTRALGSERAAPPELGPVHDGTHTGPLDGQSEGPGDAPNTWRRWPVDLVTVPNRVVREGEVLRVAPDRFAHVLYAGKEVSDAERPPVPEPFTARMALAVLASIETRLAKQPLKPDLPQTVLEALEDPDAYRSLRPDTSALEHEIREMGQSLTGSEDADGEPGGATLERLWKMEERLERDKRLTAVLDRFPSPASLRDYRQEAIRANESWRQDALRDLRDIIDQLRSGEPDRALLHGEWTDIAVHLDQTRTSYFEFRSAGGSEQTLQAFERDISLSGLYNATYVRLWEFVADYYADPELRSLIPTDVLAQFEPFWRRLNDNRPHRTGGAFDGVQSEPKSGPASRVLLLHAASDDAMRWSWGDAGIVYFMISTQDLADGRFENATAALECY